MRFDILTIFPEIFASYLGESILKKALEKSLIQLEVHDIRKFSKNKHKKVDDIPFGGGYGMLLTPQPLYDCIMEVKKQNSGPVVYLTPQGKTLTQARVENLAKKHAEGMILLCGRYEGIDQRIRDNFVDLELSIGEYVLTGGELPAMVLIDAVSRLIPGVLGKEESHQEESFSKILGRKREYPQYTRPADFMGMKVPDVLTSGDHAKIQKWKLQNLK